MIGRGGRGRGGAKSGGGGGFYSSADTRRFFENCTYNHITITAR